MPMPAPKDWLEFGVLGVLFARDVFHTFVLHPREHELWNSQLSFLREQMAKAWKIIETFFKGHPEPRKRNEQPGTAG